MIAQDAPGTTTVTSDYLCVDSIRAAADHVAVRIIDREASRTAADDNLCSRLEAGLPVASDRFLMTTGCL